MIERCRPPYTFGTTAPGTVTSCERTKFSPRSFNCCSLRPLPDRASCKIGTVDAEKSMICGASVPGGSECRINSEAEETCAFAVSSDAPGCRYTFTITSPRSVVDSVCWMLSTSVVSTFSYGVVSRPSSSSGASPVYCQAIEITGMSMFGKMSVGVRRITTGAAIRIRIARTMNV